MSPGIPRPSGDSIMPTGIEIKNFGRKVMSKRKRLLGVFALALTAAVAAVFGVGVTATAAAPDFSGNNLQILNVGEADPHGTTNVMSVSLHINKNCGTNGFAVTIDASKVVYTQKTGGTRTLSGASYVWADFIPQIVLTFNGDTYEGGKAVYGVGDTLTLLTGFTFSSPFAGSVPSMAEDVTLTYTENGWTGSFPFDNLQSVTVRNTQIEEFAVGVIIDFGLTGVNSAKVFADKDWTADLWPAIAERIRYESNSDNNVFNRAWLNTDGKFAITNATAVLTPVKGDVIRIVKGTQFYEFTAAAGQFGQGSGANNYRPVLEILEDMIFCYDGTEWTKAVPATSASFTNTQEEKDSLSVGTTLQLTWQTNEGAIEPVPTFESSAPGVATVNAAGLVTGVSEGTATITARFLNITSTVELTVSKTPEKSGVRVTVTNGSVREGKTYLVAYKGETLDAAKTAGKLSARFTFDNGTEGTDFEVTAEMITFEKFDSAAAGETSVTLTAEGFSADVPVWVYEVKEISAPAPARVAEWGGAINLLFETLPEGSVDVKTVNIAQNPKYGIDAGMAVLREPAYSVSDKNYALGSIGRTNNQQALLYFDNYTSSSALSVGTVLTLKDNYRYYLWLDEYWIAAAKLSGEVSYVWDGSAWQNFTADAESVTVAENKVEIYTGSEKTITYTLVPAGSYVTPAIVSDHPEIAEIRGGKIFGKTLGTATVTLTVGENTVSIAVTVKEPPAKNGIQVTISSGSVREEKTYLVCYKDEILTKANVADKLTARFTYDDGSFSSEFEVTEEMISFGKFDSAEAGETSVTLTHDGLSADVPVWVYEIAELDPVAPGYVKTYAAAIDLHFEKQIPGNETSNVQPAVNIESNPQYGFDASLAVLREPTHGATETEYKLHSFGSVSNKQCLLFFSNFNASQKDSIRVGMVLTLKEGFRFYRYTDETWIAAYRLSKEASYVWDGSVWQTFVADAASVEVEKTEITLPKNVQLKLSYTLAPEGSYVLPTLTSSNPAVVGVSKDIITAKAPGTATVTVTVGNSSKTIEVTVLDSEPLGFVLAEPRTYYVAQGGTLDISKVKVQADYGDGFRGEAFALNSENAEFTLDTSVPGPAALAVTVTAVEAGKTVVSVVNVDVEIVQPVPQVPDNLLCADDDTFFQNQIAIYFQKTFANQSNVYPEDLSSEEAADLLSKIAFLREGAEVTVEKPSYLTFILAFTPKIGTQEISTYLEGDKIVLKQGLKFYRFYGELDGNNVPVGEGDYVCVGMLEHEVTFTYSAEGKFVMVIEYAGAEALEDIVEVGLGQQHATNVVTVPDYATNGEWFFDVADKEIASVNANGLITGKKIGETTVTARLSGGTAGDKTVTFTVKVVDTAVGIKLSSDKEITLELGTDLTAQMLIDKGVTAQIVWASGKTEGNVDISKARITGYDSEKEGVQTLTVRVSVNGRSVTGELVVKVGSSKSCGSCGIVSFTDFLSGGLILGALVGLVLLLERRRKA